MASDSYEVQNNIKGSKTTEINKEKFWGSKTHLLSPTKCFHISFNEKA